MVSLGCPKNQIDAEHLLGYISKDKRFQIVADQELADVVIINTCAFIESAKQEAIDTILEFAEFKNRGLKSIIVTGCLAERYKDEIIKEIPEVDVVLGFGSNDLIADSIIKSLNGKKITKFGDQLKMGFNHQRMLTTPKHYAYLKIAEGCDNNCTYCAIPKIRGPYRSRKMEDIMEEAKWLVQNGVKELILVAQDTTYYNYDISSEFKFAQLLKNLAKLDFKWIRFLYAYPERIDEELLYTIASEDNILPYLDLPIQHINDIILKKMNRKTTGDEIKNKISLIRRILKNAVLRTTLIAGFPGETENQFNELLQFVKESDFDRLGCFAYSQEEGTAAALLPNQIDTDTKNLRANTIMLEAEKLIEKRCKKFIDKTIDVIIDYKKNKNYYVGRSIADAPEIDCNVYFSSNVPIKNGEIVKVKVEKSEYGDLFGRVVL
ncbi:MAG: 30S ribosomal protein S12 methylthiotransferase RimO, partial [Oscillospiraceae bacterium]|nr:30S ribosomal protein S12 methylthiotransferase RimO [Oscillospiraceae bacterium]